MRPDFLSLLLLSSFLGLTASVCVPRNADPSKYLYSPPPTNSPKSSPPPKASSPGAPAPAKSSPPPSSPSPSGGASAALKPICAFTDYPNLCMSSIQSVAPLGSSVTMQDAAGLQIKALAAKAQAAIGYAKKLMGDPEVSKDAGSCLKDCLDQYDDGIDNLEAARSALARGQGQRDRKHHAERRVRLLQLLRHVLGGRGPGELQGAVADEGPLGHVQIASAKKKVPNFWGA